MQLKRIEPADLKAITSGGSSQAEEYCRLLEEGAILLFPTTPLTLDPKDLDFLRTQRQVEAAYHKNIAYRPQQNRITGVAGRSKQDRARLAGIMRDFSGQVEKLMGQLLSPYGGSWRLDYASFRPFEEESRQIKQTARNDLIHVDAFPTRPTNGDRILRFFVNINPDKSRHWVTTDPFDSIVAQHAGPGGVPLPTEPEPLLRQWGRRLARAGRALGLSPFSRSQYDQFMLRLHHHLKANQSFQTHCRKYHWEFPPSSSWMVFTDLVPHAALSGQFALEQTLLVERAGLLIPEKAPVSVLEKLCGVPLTL